MYIRGQESKRPPQNSALHTHARYRAGNRNLKLLSLFGAPQTAPIKAAELSMCVFYIHHQLAVPHLSPFPPASLFPGHNNIENRLNSNRTKASKCSHEMRKPASLTLNQKLEMIQLGEKDMSKAEIG